MWSCQTGNRHIPKASRTFTSVFPNSTSCAVILFKLMELTGDKCKRTE